MANLSLTSACPRSCTYCFAREALQGAGAMSAARFEVALDLLERSGVDEARLLGGEPTAHPLFPELLARALTRGFRVIVFTGGLMPPRALRALETAPIERLGVLVNALAPDSPRGPLARQLQVLRRLGPKATLGTTIAAPDAPLDFLLERIDEWGLARAVRLGLAHPVVSGANAFLHPRHYAEAGRRIAAFGLRARARGVRLDLDCGFVPCLFPAGALAALGLEAAALGHRCGPALDLLPDGRVVGCYALAGVEQRGLEPGLGVAALRASFAERWQSLRTFTLSRKCEGCAWRDRGECEGGCVAAALRRSRGEGFELRIPEVA